MITAGPVLVKLQGRIFGFTLGRDWVIEVDSELHSSHLSDHFQVSHAFDLKMSIIRIWMSLPQHNTPYHILYILLVSWLDVDCAMREKCCLSFEQSERMTDQQKREWLVRYKRAYSVDIHAVADENDGQFGKNSSYRHFEF